MRKPERRKNRSDKANVALDLFLDSIRKAEGIEAVAVSTEDGFLIAGAGATGTDIEWMGALGAAPSGRASSGKTAPSTCRSSR